MKYKREMATGAIFVAVLFFGLLASYQAGVNSVNLSGAVGVDLETKSIHMNIYFYQNGELLYSYHHPGVVTNLGDNATCAKLSGDSSFNQTLYNMNATYISIGDQGSLSTSSTVLPGEWNRTTGTVEDQTQSQYNVTCTFYPDNSGPYTADCIGLNFESAGLSNDLWAYDTFSEVTGIDETFTINVEFQISVSHS